MPFRFALLAAAGAALLAASPASATVTFDFTPVLGTGNPITIPVGTNTATFSSPSGPGVFVAGSTNGLYSFFQGLTDVGYNTSTFAGDTLTITFANPLTDSIAMNFGINDAFGLSGSDFLSIIPDVGAPITANTTLDNLPLQNPEGSVIINAPGATQLTINSANPFSIESVPEPVSLTIMGVGLAGLAVARRRRA